MIARALGYPYSLEKTSYILKDQSLLPWSDDLDLSNRTPVFACGSNQSPEQLRRKFPEGLIPVMAGWLDDYDSVYSAHFTTYGSIAATYHHCPGMRSRQMITWLTDAQLQTMHETEAIGVNYGYEALSDVRFLSDCGINISDGFTYNSLRGPLRLDGVTPVGLSAIEAENRPHPSNDQRGLQEHVMSVFGYTDDLETFVKETIESEQRRQERIAHLMRLSINHS